MIQDIQIVYAKPPAGGGLPDPSARGDRTHERASGGGYPGAV